MNVKTPLAALALVGLAGSAQAAPLADAASSFSYDHLGIHYIEQTITSPYGPGELDPNGVGVDLSLSLTPQAYLTAEYGRVSSDTEDHDAFGLGLGYHSDLGLLTPIDAFGEVGLRSVGSDDDRDMTFGGKVGLRTGLGIPELDARVFLGLTEPDYTNHPDGDRELSFQYGLSAAYYVSSDLSLGAGYQVVDATSQDAEKMGIDDIETTTVSLKYHF